MTDYLLTGAGGFIGSHLVREILKDPHHRVIALIRKGKDYWRLQGLGERLIFIEIDFDDFHHMLKQLEPFSPKVLFHLGWEGVVNTYKNDPLQYANQPFVEGVCKLTESLKIETLVGLGSQAEYGIKNRPIKETDSLEPVTLYGQEKVKTCHRLQSFCHRAGLKFIWLRLFASYGPMDNPEWLIPYVISTLLKGKEPLLTEGLQKWDYLYVEDVATAIFSSIEIENSGVFNLGSGKAIRIKEIVEKIYTFMTMQMEPPFGSVCTNQQQSMHLQADMSSFCSQCSWRARYSLEEGIERTLQFYLSNIAIR